MIRVPPMERRDPRAAAGMEVRSSGRALPCFERGAAA